MREMTLNSAVARYSEFSRYPLPPFPSQINVKMDHIDRYLLPHPETGKLVPYSRATTVSSTTADHYKLNRWITRKQVAAVVKAALITEKVLDPQTNVTSSELEIAKAFAELKRLIDEDPSEKGLGRHIDLIDNLMGGADAKELGGAVHDWIAELDMGRVLLHQIPEQFQVYARAYQDAMARAGLIAVPEYTERLVLNDRGSETVAGRLDGICRCVETGKLHVLDRKTSKTLDFSALEFGIQIGGVYGWATKMLKEDRSGWDPMPEIDHDMAFIAHIPSDQPERSQIIPIAMWPGGESMVTALKVREERRSAKTTFFGQSYPVPSKKSLRYVQARQAFQRVTSKDGAENVALEYMDVVDDDLITFGAQCLELLTATTDKEN